jgi:UDP-N-acetylglucosamine/UDP-N-acetylgalactosamine 4-epimerase
MSKIQTALSELSKPAKWLVTGGAGFIGSNIVEHLLKGGQTVVVLDNLATGFEKNLDDVKSVVGPEKAARLTFHRGDIRSISDCKAAMVGGIEYVLHQAALGSVPRSIADPISSHDVNVTGFLNMLESAREANVKRFVYASSSSVYGDSPNLPKVEEVIGRPLSPYAGTKRINEIYGDIWVKTYGIQIIGLRYFNVFGPRQDPMGAYAAVIPRWIKALLDGDTVQINGDGLTSRDFCFIDNTVQANVLAALKPLESKEHQVFNVSIGGRMTLNDLLTAIVQVLRESGIDKINPLPSFGPFRQGDIAHSNADINKAKQLLGFEPTHNVLEGLREAMPWYLNDLVKKKQ